MEEAHEGSRTHVLWALWQVRTLRNSYSRTLYPKTVRKSTGVGFSFTYLQFHCSLYDTLYRWHRLLTLFKNSPELFLVANIAANDLNFALVELEVSHQLGYCRSNVSRTGNKYEVASSLLGHPSCTASSYTTETTSHHICGVLLQSICRCSWRNDGNYVFWFWHKDHLTHSFPGLENTQTFLNLGIAHDCHRIGLFDMSLCPKAHSIFCQTFDQGRPMSHHCW